MAEAFRLAALFSDWSPPARVRLTLGQTRQTLSARFTGPDGQVMTARLRLRRDPVSGAREVVGEDLSIPLQIARGGGAS
jgi:hypothetical protein